MNKKLIFTLLSLSTFIFFNSCDKAKERPATVNSKLSSQIFKLSDISTVDMSTIASSTTVSNSDISTQAASTDINTSASPASSGTANSKIIKYVISKMNNKDTAKLLLDNTDKIEISFTTNSILLVIRKDKITDDNNALLNLTKKSASELINLSENKNFTINSATDSISYIVVAEFSVTQGVLDNERTVYNEKKSTQTVVNKDGVTPTHILIGDEVSQ